jgi:hypothetical protein
VTRAAATVTLADRKTRFRELVALWVNDVQNFTVPNLQGSVNYRSEPFVWRPTLPSTAPPGSGFQAAFANGQVGGADPMTPVFRGPVGMPTRFRMLAPGSSTFTSTNMPATLIVQGHGWPESPFVARGRVLCDNPLSPRFGAQQIGAYEAYNFLFSAGGRARVTGDYLYHAYQHENGEGTWGLFRVLPYVVITRAEVNADNQLSVEGLISTGGGPETLPPKVALSSVGVSRNDDGTMAVTKKDDLASVDVNSDGTWQLKPSAAVMLKETTTISAAPAPSTALLLGLAPVTVEVQPKASP